MDGKVGSCEWIRAPRYVPLRDRYKAGKVCTVRGMTVTVYSVDLDRMQAIVRPHDNPVNLIAVDMDELEG